MLTVRQVRAVAALLVCAGFTSVSAARTRAVLIGINDYAAPGVSDLRGTHADVATMKSLLINQYGVAASDIHVLLDANATHRKIVGAIQERLIAPSAAGDVAVLYYSGHGSQMRDKSNDEADGWDETLVAHDSRLPNVFDVSDDELNALLSRLAAKTPNITVILDSCHSGTAARGISTVRKIDADPRDPPDGAAAHTRQTTPDGPSDIAALGANFTLISGARAHELSNEDFIDGQIQGILTYNLAQSLRSKAGSTYRDIFPDVAARVTARFPAQNPQLEGTGLDSNVFGLAVRPGPRYLRVEPAGSGRASMMAGAMYGLTRGAVLQVYGPPVPDEQQPAPIAKLTLTEVTTDSASGRLDSPVVIPSGSRALVSQIALGGRKRNAWLAPDLPQGLSDAIKAALKDHPGLALSRAEHDADLRVVAQNGRAAVLGRDGTALSASVELASDQAGARVGTQLEDWARWQAVLDLANPHSPYALKLSLRVAEAALGSPAPAAVSNDTRVTVRIDNPTAADLYFVLLDIGSSGRISLLYPALGSQDRIAAGGFFERTYRMSVPQGRGALVDTFKVIGADAPIDGSMFQQAAVRSQPPAQWNALQRFVADSAAGRSRDASDVAVKEWSTAQTSLLVTRSAPVIEDLSFAAHFSTPTALATVETALGGQRGLCSDPAAGTDCARAAPLLGDDTTVYEVRSPALTGQRGPANDPYKSVGQAFDEAYLLRDSLGADRVEPLLTVNMPEDQDSGAPGTRGGDAPPDPIAAGDVLWNHKYANVAPAWALVRSTTGRAAGHESEGILLAHPDTGFTRHPENWSGATPSAVFAERGRDYIDDDADATDPLLSSGMLANPGHGTASSSVIISPAACQLAGKTQCVSGTGPGTRLIPLRVHTSVVVFDTKRLARAITDAADGKLGGRVDAISIAMGGPPSLALHKAVKRAAKNGVLLIAAAGNFVQTVVWPARFDDAVAVSAINPRCVPWKHASHGRAVDISAPGEGVWRATFDGQNAFDIGMGAGTTFATGTTVGIATLWLARFAGDPQLAALRTSGQLTDAFREALRATAWRPENPASARPPGVSCDGAPRWDTKEYGAGIVDAHALLQRPLPATRALAPADGESRVPQWASIYPQDVGVARVEGGFAALFPGLVIEKSAQFETEVMYHYTMSAEVRTAVDRLVAGTGTADQVSAARNALLTQDLSLRLRAALSGA